MAEDGQARSTGASSLVCNNRDLTDVGVRVAFSDGTSNIDERRARSCCSSQPQDRPLRLVSLGIGSCARRLLASFSGKLPLPHFNNQVFPTDPIVVILHQQTLEQPRIDLRAFTDDETEQLYTLVMVDPDLPDTANLSYKEYCHWIV